MKLSKNKTLCESSRLDLVKNISIIIVPRYEINP